MTYNANYLVSVVVALFNAISKSKRGAMGGAGDSKEGADSSKNKNANDDDDNDSWHSNDVEETAAKSSSGKSKSKVVSSSSSSSKRSSSSNSQKPGESSKKWSVFEEDSIAQRKLSLKVIIASLIILLNFQHFYSISSSPSPLFINLFTN